MVDKNWNRVKIKTENYLKLHQNNSGSNWVVKYLTGELDNLLGDLKSPGLQKVRDDYHRLYTAYYEKTEKQLADGLKEKKASLRSKTFPSFLKRFLRGSFVWDKELRKILIKNRKFREKIFNPK